MDDPMSLQIPDLIDFNDDDMTPGFLQKGMKKINKNSSSKIEEEEKSIYEGPGFINPLQMNIKKDDAAKMFRFQSTSAHPSDEFENQMFHISDINVPSPGKEFIRIKGVSNGVVLKNKKRTCNFETGSYLNFYDNLQE